MLSLVILTVVALQFHSPASLNDSTCRKPHAVPTSESLCVHTRCFTQQPIPGFWIAEDSVMSAPGVLAVRTWDVSHDPPPPPLSGPKAHLATVWFTRHVPLRRVHGAPAGVVAIRSSSVTWDVLTACPRSCTDKSIWLLPHP